MPGLCDRGVSTFLGMQMVYVSMPAFALVISAMLITSFKVFTSRGLFIRSDIQDQGDVFIVRRCSERHDCSVDVVVPIYHQFLAK